MTNKHDRTTQPTTAGWIRRTAVVLFTGSLVALGAATTAYAAPPTPPTGPGSPLAKAQAHSPGAACGYGTSAKASHVFCRAHGAPDSARATAAAKRPPKAGQKAPRTTPRVPAATPHNTAVPQLALPKDVTPADVILPAQCASPDFTDPGANYWWPDRFTACGGVIWTLTEHQIVDGEDVIIGTLVFEVDQWASYSDINNDPSWIHGVIITVDLAEESLADVLGALDSHCTTNPSLCQTRAALLPDPNEFEFLQGQRWSNEYTESSTAMLAGTTNVDYLSGYIGMDFGFAWGTFTDDGSVWPEGVPPMQGRCDSISRSIKCVNDYYTPTLTYSAITNPLVAPVAQHVYDAELTLTVNHWGHPYLGLALYYDSSPTDQAANNRAACAGVTSPPGFNCDEYPMASTYEGAAFNSDYSITTVPISANSSQGGITGNFYATNHVLDGTDAFWVKAVLANGTSSW